MSHTRKRTSAAAPRARVRWISIFQCHRHATSRDCYFVQRAARDCRGRLGKKEERKNMVSERDSVRISCWFIYAIKLGVTAVVY